jgi:hypothetical protein
MKTLKTLVLLSSVLICSFPLTAQTADEIINKYIDAIGGKDLLTKIESVYTESTMDIMGMEGTIKTTTLNRKGIRQDMDIMGSIISTCYTDQGGWSLNPMAGSYSAEDMPEQQYNSGKDQIYVGGQFLNYEDKGYEVELVGKEPVKDKEAYKIKVTLPGNTTNYYFFDPETYYLVHSIQEADMQGQITTNDITYSDYKDIDGYVLPHKIDMDIAGGQFTMAMTITKVELNKPVDEAIFAKP